MSPCNFPYFLCYSGISLFYTPATMNALQCFKSLDEIIAERMEVDGETLALPPSTPPEHGKHAQGMFQFHKLGNLCAILEHTCLGLYDGPIGHQYISRIFPDLDLCFARRSHICSCPGVCCCFLQPLVAGPHDF
jgi:hypothetical protein